MKQQICLFLLIFAGCVSGREKYVVDEGTTTVLPSNDFELVTDLRNNQELNITRRDSTDKQDISTESDIFQFSKDIEGYDETKREYAQVQEDLFDIDDLPLELVKNATLLEDLVNATRHRGILHGFSESISVILVSEIGDKTFFIAAILAMRNNKLTVFLAALSALFLMTVLSALLGWVVTTFIPR